MFKDFSSGIFCWKNNSNSYSFKTLSKIVSEKVTSILKSSVKKLSKLMLIH